MLPAEAAAAALSPLAAALQPAQAAPGTDTPQLGQPQALAVSPGAASLSPATPTLLAQMNVSQQGQQHEHGLAL